MPKSTYGIENQRIKIGFQPRFLVK